MLRCFICGAGVDEQSPFNSELIEIPDLCSRCEAAAQAASDGTPEFDFHADVCDRVELAVLAENSAADIPF